MGSWCADVGGQNELQVIACVGAAKDLGEVEAVGPYNTNQDAFFQRGSTAGVTSDKNEGTCKKGGRDAFPHNCGQKMGQHEMRGLGAFSHTTRKKHRTK